MSYTKQAMEETADFYDQQVQNMFFKGYQKKYPPNQKTINMDRDSQTEIDKENFNYDGNVSNDSPLILSGDFKQMPPPEANRIPHQTDPVNPAHYQNVAAGLQYMELMVDMLADKKGVEAHLYGQVYKYLMRAGKKDSELQDIRKAQWYLNSLVNYQENGEIIL